MQLVVTILLVTCAVARADTQFASKIQVYTDSDHTQVISPVVQAQSDVTSDTSVSLGYLVDAVSSASIDIVTQASPHEMHDTRHQVSTGLTHVIDTITASGGYSYSVEHDYLSHTFNAGLEDALDDKNTTIAVGYGASLNTVGRSGDLNFARSLTVHHASASWTQVINARLVTQLTYELGYASGFQSSPYRFVPVRATLDATPELWVAETDPDIRWRHAVVLGVNRAVGEDSSVQADYRLYRDTWGITSHTVGVRYYLSLAKNLELRLRERFYVQNGAAFYQSLYMAPARYITYDRELSPLWSETLGGKLTYGFSRHVEGELKLDLFYYRYADFPPLASRTGANAGIGVSLTY